MDLRKTDFQHDAAAAEYRVTARIAGPAPKGASTMHFHQSCPTCGRKLMVQVEYLGRRVFCTHCRSPFIASDGSHHYEGANGGGGTVLERAERLLALLEPDRLPRWTWDA